MKKIWRKYLIVFVMAGLSGALLLQTSQSVQQAEDELHNLQKSVENERETIRVLHAEWAHLNRPDRLESLAGQYLGLAPLGPGQVLADPAQLPDPFVPVVPPVKPAYLGKAQPVVLESIVAPAPPDIKQEIKPSTSDKSFEELLEGIKSEDKQ